MCLPTASCSLFCTDSILGLGRGRTVWLRSGHTQASGRSVSWGLAWSLLFSVILGGHGGLHSVLCSLQKHRGPSLLCFATWGVFAHPLLRLICGVLARQSGQVESCVNTPTIKGSSLVLVIQLRGMKVPSAHVCRVSQGCKWLGPRVGAGAITSQAGS
jgi:hypothetical protein